MALSLFWRKLALIIHVISSVGWIGAIAGFLVLAIIGINTSDAFKVRVCYIGMDLIAWYIILPLSFASFLSGLIMSLGTSWGLFQHYWVVFKLIINVLCVLILMLHMRPISDMAKAVAEKTLAPADMHDMRLQLIVNAAAGIAALLIATGLSVYKPKGLTPYGWSKMKEKGGN